MAKPTYIYEVKRGLKANLPSEGKLGELFFTIDTHEMFVGEGAGHPLATVGGADDDSSLTTKIYVDAQDVTVLSTAEGYTDTKIVSEVTRADAAYDAAGAASTAQSTAESFATAADATVLSTAEGYTDSAVAPKLNTTALQAKTAQVITGTVTAGSTEVGTVSLAKGFMLLLVQTDKKARVELYETAAQQAADAARPATVPPTAGTQHGVILDLVLTTAETFKLSPSVYGANLEDTRTNDITYAITNTNSTDQVITVTFTFVQLEQ
jgi:hypothetical protein